MKFRRRQAEPEPPKNVRVVYPDGRVVPLECVYLGLDDGGMRLWHATLSVELDRGMSVTCDQLPPKTGVVVAAWEEVEL